MAERSKDIFFPIVNIAPVIAHAKMDGQVRSTMLSEDATGNDVKKYLTQCMTGESNTQGRVKIARAMVEDLLHPVVLHALAATPRTEALETVVAEAVAGEAFTWAVPFQIMDMVTDLVSLVAIS